MVDLRNLNELEKRKWLVQEMKNKWQLDIENDDCSDDAIVCGNADIKFCDILKLCQQLDWQGFKFGDMEILIDIKVQREIFRNSDGNYEKRCWLSCPDEFDICNGVIRIWYD